MSKELTVEAENFKDAMDKAKAMMAEPIPDKEMTMTKVYFDDIRMGDSQFECRMS